MRFGQAFLNQFPQFNNGAELTQVLYQEPDMEKAERLLFYNFVQQGW